MAQDLAAGHARRLAIATRASAIASRSVMTWQIESFTDVGGNKDQEFVRVHRSAVAHGAAVRARDQRAAEAAARARLGTRSTRWRYRETPATYRDFIQRSKAEFGVAKHTYVATPIRLVQRSDRVLPRRPGVPRSCRTPAGARAPAGRRRTARLLVPGRRAGRHRRASTADYPRHARRARARSPHEHFDARRILTAPR